MGLVLLRVLLLFTAAALVAGVVSATTGAGFSLALTPQLSALYFVPVNLLCLWLLERRVASVGGLRRLLGFERGRLGRDALQGLLWMVVLFVPFVLAVNLVMLLLFGPSGMLDAYEVVFAPDPALALEWPYRFALGSALVTAVLFPLTNAPAEELVYRGHAQGELLAAGRPAAVAVLLPAVAFGLQHLLLAPSAAGMLVYGVAFLAWGLGAGLIYLRRRRLMPLVMAHLYTNAMFSVLPLVFVLTGA